MRLYIWVYLALVVLAGLLLVGCGTQSDGPIPTTAVSGTTAGAGGTTGPETTVGPGASDLRDGAEVRVYFFCEEKVCTVSRAVSCAEDDLDGVAFAAVNALPAGPTAEESARGVVSSVPEGTKVLALENEHGIMTVDLSAEYASGGGSLSTLMRLAEVVFTLTQFPEVTGVELKVAGEAVEEFGSEGFVISHPMTRLDFERLSPAILVESPLPGATVSSPLRVEGTSNTFEATCLVKLLDGRGAQIALEVVTATSGNGERGTFEVAIPFTIAVTGPGTIVAYEESAEDGSVINEVRIPVVLEK